MPAGAWAPEATDLAALGTDERLIAAVLARYEVALVEGCVLIEAGHAADALTIVRAAAQPDVVTQRLELQLSKHYAALLAQLHLEKV